MPQPTYFGRHFDPNFLGGGTVLWDEHNLKKNVFKQNGVLNGFVYLYMLKQFKIIHFGSLFDEKKAFLSQFF